MGIYKSIDIVAATNLYNSDTDIFCKEIGILLERNIVLTIYRNGDVIGTKQFELGFLEFADCRYNIDEADEYVLETQMYYELESKEDFARGMGMLRIFDNGLLCVFMNYTISQWNSFEKIITKTNDSSLDFYRYETKEKTNAAYLLLEQLGCNSIFTVPDIVSEILEDKAAEFYTKHQQTITRDFICAVVKEELGDVIEISDSLN
ncbi:MAG: hypothetical protein NTZ59_14335 [Bacteroidetes bacterium]|nr:hypothetical protein [Bacteroidota bacterium]